MEQKKYEKYGMIGVIAIVVALGIKAGYCCTYVRDIVVVNIK